MQKDFPDQSSTAVASILRPPATGTIFQIRPFFKYVNIHFFKNMIDCWIFPVTGAGLDARWLDPT